MRQTTKLFYCALMAFGLGLMAFAAFGTPIAFAIGALVGMTAPYSGLKISQGLSFASVLWIDDETQKFRALGDEEIKKLDEDQQLAYAKAKDKATQERLDAAFAALDAAKEKGDTTDDALKALKDEVMEAQKESNEAMKSLQRQVAELLKKGSSQVLEIKAPQELIADALKEQMDEILAKKGNGFVKLDIKAPATITRPDNITGASADRLPRPEYVPGLILIPERMPFITDFLDVATTSSSVITYTEEKNPEGDFAMTAENTLKPLLDFEISPADSKAEVNAGVIKVSKQMLSDIEFMASEINRRLRKKHDLNLEDQILNGDGISPNFNGITNQAPAFAAGSLAAQVVTPNNSDVIRAAINQIVVSSDEAFYPNAVFVHPDDLALMDLQKDSQGAYVLPPFQTTDGRTIAGVRVLGKTKIPTGFFLVGDFMQGRHRGYEPFSIQVGWENDDFRKNLVTILGESRTHFYIPSNDLSAFVYDQFSVAKTALETP